MNSRERAVVSGIHGLQHVEGFAAAHLAQYDPIRAHTKRVDDQVALTNGAFALDVGGTTLHTGNVLLLELQFG